MTESTKDEKDKLEESPSPSVKNGENQMETSWTRWIDAPFITIALTGVFYFGGRIYVENYYTNLGLPIDLYSDNFRILVGEGWIELILFLAFLLFILFILSHLYFSILVFCYIFYSSYPQQIVCDKFIIYIKPILTSLL